MASSAAPSSSSSSSSPTTTTTSAPSTSAAATTTTVDEIAQTKAAVAAAVSAARSNYLYAVRNYDAPDALTVLASTTVADSPSYLQATQNIDTLRSHGWKSRENPQVPSASTVEGDVELSGGPPATKALVTVCTIDSGVVFEPGGAPDGSDTIVNDEIVAERDPCDPRARERSLEALRGHEPRFLDRTDDVSGCLSVRATFLVLAVAAVVAAQGPGVDAAEGGQTSQGSDTGAGTVTATASQDLVGGRAASGASASRPRCSWEVFVDLQQATNPDGGGEVPPIRREADGSIPPAGSPPTKTTSTLYKRVCEGAAGFDLAWVPDFVDVDALVASARRSVTAQLPEPAMDMNPDPSVGGIVNIGLWLAVADPGQVSITASVGPVWATVTARYADHDVELRQRRLGGV